MERLEMRDLMARARAQTGLDDFGDLPFEEALEMLIFSLERDAKLDAARRAGAAQMIIGTLAKNLRLVEDRKRFPAEFHHFSVCISDSPGADDFSD